MGLFYVFGKFFYNKCEIIEVMEIKGFEIMDESLRRSSVRYDFEEVFLCFGIGVEIVVGFLFENFLDFIDFRCIDWVVVGMRYLLDVAILV